MEKNKLIAIIKLLVLLVMMLGIPVYLLIFNHDLLMSFDSLDDVQTFLLKYETASVFIYLGLQIFHLMLIFVPGQPFHIASGFVFGFWFGYLLSIIGVLLGSAITFYLSRILGKDAIYLIFGERKFNKFIRLMNSKRGMIIILLMYLFPGFPKEGLGYIVGLSKIKLLPFLLIVLIGRTPSLMVSVAIGSMYDHGSYMGIIIIIAIMIVLALISLINRKKILKTINDWFEKIAKD